VKLELSKRNTERDIFDMFPAFKRCRPCNQREAKKNFSRTTCILCRNSSQRIEI